jgi:predicted PurR-regulated permease PerM
MEDILPPPQAEETGRQRIWPVVIITALVSALISLLIAILRLGNRQEHELARQYAMEMTGQDQPAAPLALTTANGAPPVYAVSPAGPGPAEHHTHKTASKPLPAGTMARGQTAGNPPIQAYSDIATPVALNPTTRWSLATKYVVGVGLFMALLFVVYISRSTIPMIIFAALIAFVAQPMINYFQRRWKMKRGSAIGLAYLLVTTLLILIPLVIIPAILQSINNVLSVNWQQIGQNLAASLQTAAQSASTIPVVGEKIASTMDSLAQILTSTASQPVPSPITVDVTTVNLQEQMAETLGRFAKVVGTTISAITSFIFMMLISLRISLSSDEMRQAYPRLIPPAYRNEFTSLVENLLHTWSSFLGGQLSLMVVMGFLTYLMNLLLGTPYALFLGFLAGILEIIPNLGPVLATIPAVIFALMFGSTRFVNMDHVVFAILVVAAYIVLSGVENQILVPKIFGDAVNLHPLVVIVGCVIGGAVAGLLGIFLATPVISTSKIIFAYLYNKILEPPPVIEVEEEKPSMRDTFRGLTQRIRSPFQRRKEKASPELLAPEPEAP